MANDSAPNSYADLCATAKALRIDAVVRYSGIGQTILALVTLILILAAILSYKKHRISLHPNLKLLFVNIIFLYVFHNIFIVILQARRYEQEGLWYPVLCITVIWTLTLLEIGYIVVQALQDPKFSQPLIQATLTSETNATFQIYMNLVGLALVIVTAIMDYLLLVANRKNRSRNSDYSLSRIYQIKENIDIMNFIWPLDVWYAVVFTIYLAGGTYIRIIKSKISYAQYIGYYDALTMIVSMHSIVTLLLYLRFAKKCRSRATGFISEQNDPTRTHFEQLSAQWDINLK